VSGNFVFMKNRHFFGVVTQENNEKKEERKGGERIVGGVPRFNIGTWGLCDRLCLVLVCRGRYGLGGGSSLHSRIEFGRSRTGEGSSRSLGFGEKWNLPAQHQKIQMVKVNATRHTCTHQVCVHTHV